MTDAAPEASQQVAMQRQLSATGERLKALMTAIDRSQMRVEFSMDGFILEANENYFQAGQAGQS